MSVTKPPIIHLGALLRTLLAPLLFWGVLIFGATSAGQPGVICMTPMAWLLALWSGGQYVRLAGSSPRRLPLLGPGLVGAMLGTALGVMFVTFTTIAMPVGPDPEEMRKAQNINLIISIGGVVTCTALSMITAGLTLQRQRREG